MQKFELLNGITAVCESQKTRSGFRHVATLFSASGAEIAKAKITYVNRTWESYQFQTVLIKLVRGANLDKEVQESIVKLLNERS